MKWLIALGVLALVVVGFLFFRLPQPIIELRPEPVFNLGPLEVTNTMLTSWVMVALISLVAILGTRKLSLVPRGFQNLFEAIVEGFGNIVNGVAGEANGRRFFPLVFVFFLYIVVSNWTALTPLFNVVGVTDDVREHVHHEAAEHPDDEFAEGEIRGWIMSKGGITLVPLFEEVTFVSVKPQPGWTNLDAEHALDCSIAKELDRAAPADLHCERYLTEPPATTDEPAGEHGVLHDDETFGFIAPFLRGVNTDLNAPLAYAIWSAIFVEFWGITALGLFAYGSKFFNFKGGPIGIFVGLLELISEFARLISFTFRLFGNIFAGEVLLFMMSFLVPFVLVDVFYGLELFVGLIQAFVFAMLTLVFGVMAVSGHGDHEEHHDAGHGAGRHAAAEHHA